MPTPRDPVSAAAQIEALLRRVRRRAGVRHVLQGAAAGILVFGLLLVVLLRTSLSAGAGAVLAATSGIALGIALVLWRAGARTARMAAAAIERVYPSLRNLAVTAEELLAAPEGVPDYMRARVLQDAARALTGVDAARAAPLARDITLLVVTVVAVVVATPYLAVRRAAEAALPLAARSGSAAAVRTGQLTIDLAPPAYARLPAARLVDPSAVSALADSVATIGLGGVSSPSVRINGAAVPASADGTVRATLRESGYIAVDAGEVHRLLPLTVTADASPSVRVTAPGKDLRVADGRTVIPVHAAAADDLGLSTLEIRYTVVSGGGEQFTFTEGRLPAAVAKASPRAWSADATLSLPALKLEPGDALIYRAVATDARPGAPEASSDTYFVEIAGPGDLALEGVEMPPDKERYALSEAMIVVKLQRLIAAQPRLQRAAVAETAAAIAGEQRAVRANFIYLLGGEVEDEVVEAEASHEIQEGRLANQARKEIVTATVLMARVEQSLAAVAPRDALPLAQQAVRTLQQAFGHSRYLLRALPARIRIDPARRLSGDLATVQDWRRVLEPPASDPTTEAARRAMGDLASLSRNPSAGDARQRFTELAERLLATAGGAADLQASARLLIEARDAFARGDAARGRAALQLAAAPILARAQRGRLDVPATDPDVLRLAGAAATAGKGSR